MATTFAPAPKSTSPRHGLVRNFIGGDWVPGDGPTIEVHAPATGEVIARTPLSTAAAVDAAVLVAQRALPAWSATPIKERVQVLFRYRTLLERHMGELSALIVEEHGKVEGEARAEILKAIELTEFACALPQLATGEVLEVSRGVECRTEQHPVGIVASIVPLSAARIAALLAEAGLPPGVFSVVHGSHEAAGALCDHPGIAAITFVGSTSVAKAVYRRGTQNLKRVLALGGAKNHLIVMPDAEPEMTSSNVAASMSGCSGQRCMAASVMVAVGDTNAIVARVVEHARTLVAGDTLGPVISRDAKERIERYITEAELAGARVLLDGGGVDRALEIEAASPFGNAAAVSTERGSSARLVAERATAGMIGINVGVPVPREPFGFGGWGDSSFGVGNITGRGSIEFWTRTKKTTTKWNRDAGTNWMS